MPKQKQIFFILLTLWAYACVEPFETISENSLDKLLVEATLTDEDIQQKISIYRSVAKGEIAFKEPIVNLKVEVRVNNKQTILLTHQGEGIYALPENFRAKSGDSYKLIFQKPDGTRYESTEQQMPKTTKIDKIYDIFVPDGIVKETTKIPCNNLYVDFQDPANEQNYYTWSWTLWERQFICHTEFSVDYYCRQNCWEVLRNDTWNIFSDIYSNGKPIYNKLVAQIPYYQHRGALVEIKQLAISAEAYRFLKILSEQTERTGTLVDTPPAAIIGNVKNLTNPSEPIVGFFMVGSVNTIHYWLNRENAQDRATPVGLLGRKPNPNSFGATATCIEGPTRTPQKPFWWKE